MKYFFSIIAFFTLLVSTASADQHLGRLFFTPVQRSQMELGKSQSASPESTVTSLTVNGVFQKEGGRRTVWINGVPRDIGTSSDNDPGTVTIQIPHQSQSVKVKVGEKINIRHDETPPH